MAATELDHQIKSGERLLLGQDLPDEILSMEAFLVEEASSFLVVGLDASLERAALMVTLDVFRKKPRAAAKYSNLIITRCQMMKGTFQCFGR